VLGVAVLGLSACSALRAQAELDSLIRHANENTEAWQNARVRLRSMCTAASVPCGPRLVKLTNTDRTDDWGWDTLPAYVTIVSVHDEELRRRHTPRVYEEYVLGATRYLADLADRGAVTPVQMALATNEAWRWMTEQMRLEAALLADSVRAAEAADALAWQRFNALAGSLANVMSAAIIAGAAATPAPAPMALPAPAPSPRPTFCQATPWRNSVTGQVVSVNVHCR
jgi:hypothetical protein